MERWRETLKNHGRRGVFFHSHLPPREHLPFVVHCTHLHCFFFLCRETCPCVSSARDGLFKLSFTRRDMLITNFLFEVLDHHVVWYVSRITLVKCILNVQREQWLQLFCVEATKIFLKNLQIFLVELRLHRDYRSSHRGLYVVNWTFKVSLSSKLIRLCR